MMKKYLNLSLIYAIAAMAGGEETVMEMGLVLYDCPYIWTLPDKNIFMLQQNIKKGTLKLQRGEKFWNREGSNWINNLKKTG